MTQLRIFIANPPPGVMDWTPMLNVLRPEGYWETFYQGHLPFTGVFNPIIPSTTVRWMTFLRDFQGNVVARQDIYPEFTISEGIYAYDWFHNRLVKTHVIPAAVVRPARYWLEVSRTPTLEELQGELQPYGMSSRWRVIIRTTAPSSVLTAILWAGYAHWWTLKQTVKAAGAEVEKIEVVGSDIRIHIHGSPAWWLPILIAIGIFAATAITWRITEWRIQVEMTEQAYYAWQHAKTYQDVVEYVTSSPFWTCQHCGFQMFYEPEVCPQCGSVNIKREGGLGITDPGEFALFVDRFPQTQPIPDDDDRWYEKYIKWGVAIGAVVLIAPRLIREIRHGNK